MALQTQYVGDQPPSVAPPTDANAPGGVAYVGPPANQVIDLSGLAPLPPPPEATLGHYAGLGGRIVTGGVLTPEEMAYQAPFFAANAAGWASKKLGGPEFGVPYQPGPSDFVPTAMGLPEPRTPNEMTAVGAGQGLVGAVAGNPIVARVLRGLGLGRAADVVGEQPTGQAAVQGAIQGGVQGYLAGQGANPWAQALAGLGAGGLTGMVSGGMTPGLSAETRALLNVGRGKFNIPIAGMQADPFGRWVFATTKEFPFSGGEAFSTVQRNAYNEAVAQRFGESVANTDGKITIGQGGVLDQADARIGNDYSTVASRAQGPMSAKFQTALQNIRAAADGLSSLGGSDIVKRIDALYDTQAKNPNGILTGGVLMGEINNNSPAAIGARTGNTVQPLWEQYRQAVRDFVGDNLSPQDQALYAQANRQYRNLKMAEGAINADGNVMPGMFAASVANNAKKMSGVDPDMLQLAHVSKFIREPPQSGTAPRAATFELLKDLTLSGAALASPAVAGAAGHEGAGLGVLATAAAGSLAQRAMQLGARMPSESTPAFIARTYLSAPTQPQMGAPGYSAPPTVGAEKMSPYWRVLMGLGPQDVADYAR